MEVFLATTSAATAGKVIEIFFRFTKAAVDCIYIHEKLSQSPKFFVKKKCATLSKFVLRTIKTNPELSVFMKKYEFEMEISSGQMMYFNHFAYLLMNIKLRI